MGAAWRSDAKGSLDLYQARMKKAFLWNAFFVLICDGTRGWSRTNGLLLRRQALYPLSYASTSKYINTTPLISRLDRDLFYPDRFDGSLAFLWLNTGYRSDIIHPIDHLAKDRIFAVKTRFRFQHDEKL